MQVEQVLSVFPHLDRQLVTQDVMQTRSVNATLERIVMGLVVQPKVARVAMPPTQDATGQPLSLSQRKAILIESCRKYALVLNLSTS